MRSTFGLCFLTATLMTVAGFGFLGGMDHQARRDHAAVHAWRQKVAGLEQEKKFLRGELMQMVQVWGADLKPLTEEEFQLWLEENRRAREEDPPPAPPARPVEPVPAPLDDAAPQCRPAQ